MVYKVRFSRDAASYFSRLDKPTKQRISDTIDQLAINPYDKMLDIKPLVGRGDEYRLRVGKYRVLYTLDDDIVLIYVVDINSRGDIYKK